MRQPARGFTLVELLVVIAIIALLVSILLPYGRPIIDLANRVRCQAQLRGLAAAYMGYVTQAGRFPPLWTPIEYDFIRNEYKSWYYPQHDYRVIVDARYDANFGPLVWHRLITDPNTFICPAVRDTDFQWWHDRPLPDDPGNFWTSQFSNLNPVEQLDLYYRQGRLDTNTHSRSSYGIRPYLYPRTPGRVQALGLRALMADNFNVPVTVLERHVDGVNVAYIDGSVQYVRERILWDNNLTWDYVPKSPTVDEIWRTLDNHR